MHLWPSMRIRDSFKIAYLKKLEWNLGRMNSERKSQANQQKLLDNDGNGVADGEVVDATSSKTSWGRSAAVVCRDIIMVLSCCYCCFCCGACVDQEED